MNSTVDLKSKDLLDDFVHRYHKDDVMKALEQGRGHVEVDYGNLVQAEPDLADDLLDSPDEGIDVLTDAINTIETGVEHDRDLEVRVVGEPNQVGIRELRQEEVNRLVTVKGMTAKATRVLPEITEAVFECQRCGAWTRVEQSTEDFQEPHSCTGCENKGPFELDTQESEMVNSQIISVQENPEGLRGGQTPESITVHLEDGLCATVAPGDRVTVTGVLRAVDKGNKRLDYKVEAVTVESEEEALDEVEITEEERRKIQELAEEDGVHEKLVESFAPSIHGHTKAKLGIVLQLFGAARKTTEDGLNKRGDVHLLLVGDPGTGKSQLLKYAHEITPRGVFTSGKGASAAGLTAAAVRDDLGEDEWTLEAGALVMADKGLASVDELDKMDSSDRQGLHEALEQQQVSVSKAGINATFQARCSLLAAANPRDGRFDQHEHVLSQITLEPALFSRFDLVFIIEDRNEREEDEVLADHIVETTTASQRSARDESYETGVEPEIDAETLRKYISYARRNVKPVLSDRAAREIKNHFVDLRDTGDDDRVPVTPRHLEAVNRLAEASARIRLSEEVTAADAERAIELAMHYLRQVGKDPETGEFDVDVIETGVPTSQREKIKKIRQVIDDLETDGEAPDGKASKKEVYRELEEYEIDELEAEEIIEGMLREGTLISPTKDTLRLT